MATNLRKLLFFGKWTGGDNNSTSYNGDDGELPPEWKQLLRRNLELEGALEDMTEQIIATRTQMDVMRKKHEEEILAISLQTTCALCGGKMDKQTASEQNMTTGPTLGPERRVDQSTSMDYCGEVDTLLRDIFAEQERSQAQMDELSTFYEKTLEIMNKEHAAAINITLAENDLKILKVHEDYAELVKTLISQHEVFLSQLKHEFESEASSLKLQGPRALYVSFINVMDESKPYLLVILCVLGTVAVAWMGWPAIEWLWPSLLTTARRLPSLIGSKDVVTTAQKIMASPQFHIFLTKWGNGESFRDCLSVFANQQSMISALQYTAEVVSFVLSSRPSVLQRFKTS